MSTRVTLIPDEVVLIIPLALMLQVLDRLAVHLVQREDEVLGLAPGSVGQGQELGQRGEGSRGGGAKNKPPPTNE